MSTPWTREEEIIVFNLYCRIPFKNSSKNHPDVIKIANLIGRSPSAVNMKIGNFGSFDPTLREKGIVGLINASKLDKQIWDEFHEKWDELSYESEKLLEDKYLCKPDELGNSNDIHPDGYDREVSRKERVNQNFFRGAVLSSYDSKCCITGLPIVSLLIASHIKPWCDCSPSEKTNPRNGLCLNALYDKAYDAGFITVTTDYRVKVSPCIREKYDTKIVAECFRTYDGTKITLPEKFVPDKLFLEYHNDVVFRH